MQKFTLQYQIAFFVVKLFSTNLLRISDLKFRTEDFEWLTPQSWFCFVFFFSTRACYRSLSVRPSMGRPPFAYQRRTTATAGLQIAPGAKTSKAAFLASAPQTGSGVTTTSAFRWCGSAIRTRTAATNRTSRLIALRGNVAKMNSGKRCLRAIDFVLSAAGSVSLFTLLFRCKNGRCIPNSWICDGEFDCLDREDENDCSETHLCNSMYFKCQNNK